MTLRSGHRRLRMDILALKGKLLQEPSLSMAKFWTHQRRYAYPSYQQILSSFDYE